MATAIEPVNPIHRRRGGVIFGPELRKLREARGETLEQSARGIGIYASTLYRLEKGLRGAGYEIAQAIAEYHNIALDKIRSA